MKKTITALLLIAAGVQVSAQTIGDAYTFSQNNYAGTARTVGMGNAVTVVGGDLGTIEFNPAGSAVYGYSQFSLTPSISISSMTAQGTPLSGTNEPYGFQDNNIMRYPKFTMPSVGAVMNIKTGRHSGIKSWSFGFVGHATNNFLRDVYASGSNINTSYAGFLANMANGYEADALLASNALDQCSWRAVTAYQSNMISTFGGHTNEYIGITERIDGDNISLADEINQYYGWIRTGSKYDMLFNFGMNISDRFFIGANLGITDITLQSNEYWKEEAVDMKNFAIQFKQDDGTSKDTYFDQLRMNYLYEARGAGAYLKAGFIALPVNGLRIGAAIQTPTVIGITEYYGYEGRTSFADSEFDARWNTGEGSYEYKVRSPFRANAGIAYTIGNFALVSADYEMADYSLMKFDSYSYSDEYSDLNYDIRDYFGVSHSLRAGFELKPMPQFAIRTGYNLTTSPEKDGSGKYISANRHAASFGLGYSSSGSFFADLACRFNFLPNEYFLVYEDYIPNVYSPELCTRGSLTEVLLTLGWRF